MGRAPRVAVGDMVYHVLNRANAGMSLFDVGLDYAAFLKVVREAKVRTPMRIVDYCLMPTHWHFVLWPLNDGDLSEFLYWLSMTHTQRWHAAHQTTGRGHLYQGRFKSFPVQTDRHFLTVCRYVERNALRAGMVGRAEDWRWGSAWVRLHGDSEDKELLSDGPRSWPKGWLQMLNTTRDEAEEDVLRTCIRRDRPYGEAHWVVHTAKRLGLEHTLRPPGRPPGS